ncbi:hypothetical protein PoB_003401700 [Plakobranchus ocellatus]|uniref:Uncharacterized protein n=1 Tax=Plakobranchus ocellatus TaxID=259542 RepID=A0AAV4AKU0_9GAST|nr:hypothetical protein PoB_003401700 [Plakobranchus ocellatus]
MRRGVLCVKRCSARLGGNAKTVLNWLVINLNALKRTQTIANARSQFASLSDTDRKYVVDWLKNAHKLFLFSLERHCATCTVTIYSNLLKTKSILLAGSSSLKYSKA